MGLAAIGLLVALLAAMYFFNPFHSPLKGPRAPRDHIVGVFNGLAVNN